MKISLPIRGLLAVAVLVVAGAALWPTPAEEDQRGAGLTGGQPADGKGAVELEASEAAAQGLGAGVDASKRTATDEPSDRVAPGGEEELLMLLKGQVLRAEDSLPVAGVDLVATLYVGDSPSTVEQRSLRSDRRGCFEIEIAGEGPLQGQVEVQSPVLVAATAFLGRIEGAGTHDLEPMLVTRAGVMAGRVVDDVGRPVSSATVRASRSPALNPEPGGDLTSHVLEASTDASGRFRIDGVLLGVWSLDVWSESLWSEGSTIVELREDSDEVVLALVPRPTLSGVVVSARREPIADLGLRARAQAAGRVGWAGGWVKTGADGRFVLRALPGALIGEPVELALDSGHMDMRLTPGAAEWWDDAVVLVLEQKSSTDLVLMRGDEVWERAQGDVAVRLVDGTWSLLGGFAGEEGVLRIPLGLPEFDLVALIGSGDDPTVFAAAGKVSREGEVDSLVVRACGGPPRFVPTPASHEEDESVGTSAILGIATDGGAVVPGMPIVDPRSYRGTIRERAVLVVGEVAASEDAEAQLRLACGDTPRQYVVYGKGRVLAAYPADSAGAADGLVITELAGLSVKLEGDWPAGVGLRLRSRRDPGLVLPWRGRLMASESGEVEFDNVPEGDWDLEAVPGGISVLLEEVAMAGGETLVLLLDAARFVSPRCSIEVTGEEDLDIGTATMELVRLEGGEELGPSAPIVVIDGIATIPALLHGEYLIRSGLLAGTLVLEPGREYLGGLMLR